MLQSSDLVHCCLLSYFSGAKTLNMHVVPYQNYYYFSANDLCNFLGKFKKKSNYFDYYISPWLCKNIMTICSYFSPKDDFSPPQNAKWWKYKSIFRIKVNILVFVVWCFRFLWSMVYSAFANHTEDFHKKYENNFILWWNYELKGTSCSPAQYALGIS